MTEDNFLRNIGLGPFPMPGEKKRLKVARASTNALLVAIADAERRGRSAIHAKNDQSPTEEAPAKPTDDNALTDHFPTSTTKISTTAAQELRTHRDAEELASALHKLIASGALKRDPSEEHPDAGTAGAYRWHRLTIKKKISPGKKDSDTEIADYVVVYRPLNLSERLQYKSKSGFLVTRIISAETLASKINWKTAGKQNEKTEWLSDASIEAFLAESESDMKKNGNFL